MPGMFEVAGQPGAHRRAVANSFGVARHGTDVCARAWVALRAALARDLVQPAAVGGTGAVVGGAVSLSFVKVGGPKGRPLSS
jgi:hypothetical protein